MNSWSDHAQQTRPDIVARDRSRFDPAVAYRLQAWSASQWAAAHPANPDPALVEIARRRIAEAECRSCRALPMPPTARQRPQDEQIAPDRLLRGLAFGLGLSVPLWALIVAAGALAAKALARLWGGA